jgi:hypothetical protein
MAIFADAATAAEGKVYIHGGGVTRINAPVLPWIQPQLALAVRLVTEPDDIKDEHIITLRLVDPQGAPVLPDAAVRVPPQPPPPKVEGEPTYLLLAVGIGPIPFTHQGIYRVAIIVDGDELRSLPLAVVPVTPEAEVPERESAREHEEPGGQS